MPYFDPLYTLNRGPAGRLSPRLLEIRGSNSGQDKQMHVLCVFFRRERAREREIAKFGEISVSWGNAEPLRARKHTKMLGGGGDGKTSVTKACLSNRSMSEKLQ